MRSIHASAVDRACGDRGIGMQRQTPGLAALVGCLLAILACTSNDTLFIKLTATPVPSITPTQLTLTGGYKVNDKPYLVGATFQIPLTIEPGPPVNAASALSICFPNTQVTIND